MTLFRAFYTLPKPMAMDATEAPHRRGAEDQMKLYTVKDVQTGKDWGTYRVASEEEALPAASKAYGIPMSTDQFVAHEVDGDWGAELPIAHAVIPGAWASGKVRLEVRWVEVHQKDSGELTTLPRGRSLTGPILPRERGWAIYQNGELLHLHSTKVGALLGLATEVEKLAQHWRAAAELEAADAP